MWYACCGQDAKGYKEPSARFKKPVERLSPLGTAVHSAALPCGQQMAGRFDQHNHEVQWRW